MYTPTHFAETDPTILRDAIRQIRAGELITYGADGLEASFVPLLISDDAATVTGHLAKANGQWRRADLSVPALLMWVGPDAYVSPNFYPSKMEDGRVVPPGTSQPSRPRDLVLHHEDEWKRHHVGSLTDLHERRLTSPWSVDDAPTDFIDGMVKAIVGMEIRLISLVGKWKLSQNRPQADVAGVIAGLERYGAGSHEAQVAEQMAEVAVASWPPRRRLNHAVLSSRRAGWESSRCIPTTGRGTCPAGRHQGGKGLKSGGHLAGGAYADGLAAIDDPDLAL